MKTKILKKLAQIKKLAETTGMEGKVTLKFSDCTMEEFDNAVESITEYPRNKHFIEVHFVKVTPKLIVILLLD